MRYALIGEKLTHSLSKPLHMHFFDIIGEKSSYDLIEIKKDEFDSEFKRVLNEDYSGINVTIPYKFAVMDYLSRIDGSAKKIGAVNTICADKSGYNTDFYGLLATYERFKVEIKNKDVVIMGTGGASRAVEASCEHLFAKSITYVSRNKDKKEKYKVITYDDKISGDVLINATPVGMYPNVGKSPTDDILDFKDVVDLIYNPSQTLLLKNAKEKGKNTVNGLYMLVAQGVCSQGLWHNTVYDKSITDKIYEKMCEEYENLHN